jgi:hypothetical protein
MMKRFAKMLGMSCVAALALAAMTAAGASAAGFTSSATGTLTGTQTTHHTLTTGGGGSVTCKKGHMTGTIVSTAAASQHVTVNYSECTAFGFEAIVAPATFELYANGTLDIESPFSIAVFGCATTISSSKGLKSMSYTNASGKLVVHFKITGLKSSDNGFPCSSGTTGTYTGTLIVERVGGGTYSIDP